MTQAKQDGRRVDDRDWSVLTPGERIRHVEMEGYLVIPDLLSSEQIASLKSDRPGPSAPSPFLRGFRTDTWLNRSQSSWRGR